MHEFRPLHTPLTIQFASEMNHIMSPQRGRHQAQLSIVSDYESDANYLSDVPPPAERTDDELNLAVLQRHNRAITSIEYIAPYAVVYIFSPESQQWEKSGIEGTAFVCSLLPSLELSFRYSVMVLNRRGLENFDIELLSAEDVEITDEYIILQSEKHGVLKVYGLWVFSEPPPSSTSHHRAAIAKMIQECAERVSMGRRTVFETEEENEDEIEDSIPMGRQISLKELLGQQRQQDDAWSVRSHSPHRAPAAQQRILQTNQFKPSPDTDFFRTPQRHAKPPSPAVSAQSTGGQQDVLMNIFRKATEGYRLQS